MRISPFTECPQIFLNPCLLNMLNISVLSPKNSPFFTDTNGQNKVKTLKINAVFLPFMDKACPQIRTIFVRKTHLLSFDIQTHTFVKVRKRPRFSSA